MIKEMIRKLLSIPNNVYNFFTLMRNHVKYDSSLKINGRLKCCSNSNGGIVIGSNTRINSGKNANPIGGDTRTFLFAKDNGKIIIGKNVGISNSTLIASNKIVLEDDVMIGGDCRIFDTDFHSIHYIERMENKGTKSRAVLIKKGAFIGTSSIVLKGVTIGEQSVIAAGSVVTTNVPDGELWGGVPARYIKKVD